MHWWRKLWTNSSINLSTSQSYKTCYSPLSFFCSFNQLIRILNCQPSDSTFFHAKLEHKLEILNWDTTPNNNSVRHSIVASIPACHAGDQGSIPCDGDCLFLKKALSILAFCYFEFRTYNVLRVMQRVRLLFVVHRLIRACILLLNQGWIQSAANGISKISYSTSPAVFEYSNSK